MFEVPPLVNILSEFTENYRSRGEMDPTVAIVYRRQKKEIFDEDLLRPVYNLWYNKLRTRLSGEITDGLHESQHVTQMLSAALTFIKNNKLYVASIEEAITQLILEIDTYYKKSFFLTVAA